MSEYRSRLDAKIDKLFYDYTRAGYDVIRSPGPEQVPIDLGVFRPTLIARKGPGGFIVEVKDHAGCTSMVRMQNIADDVAQYPHWRFLLITLDDITSDAFPYSSEQLPTWQALADKLKKTDALLAIDARDAFLLDIWAIFEAALRRRALLIRLPAERLPASALLAYMYTSAEISVDDIDLVTKFLNQRNNTAHYMSGHLLDADAAQFLRFVERQVIEWSELSAAIAA